ncbi:5-formyltetrahydrofolate cyclo-ligase [Endothiovibrio diazotrophicus]
MEDPDAVRRRIRRLRRGLGPGEQALHAAALTRRVSGLALFRRAGRIAFYFPVQGEIDPLPLLDRAAAMGKQVYLPVLPLYSLHRLWFAPYTEGMPTRLNRFAIPEPAVPKRALVGPMQLDLVITPLVAFDGGCNRMGMGGGYYDRSFAYLIKRTCWKKPRLLGVAHEFQRVASIERRPWDVPLDGVATEAALYWRAGAVR